MAGKEAKLADCTEKKLLTVNERILKNCHGLYVDPVDGLVSVAGSLGLELVPPRRKVTVLLLGNHSAGKSTFINWYIEDHVQKTGVAIETQGFTLVTCGKKRDSLKGAATLRLYPELHGLSEFDGVIDYLSTEFCTSKSKKFPLLTFVDTPGLVDGDVVYPYEVSDSLFWFGDYMADLILVFFDPIGQALCKRTLNVVEKLSEKHPDRIRFYLTKSDEAGNEADRQKVLMQIVQELCKRPSLNRAGFDMPTIYIPDETICKHNTRCLNQMPSLIDELDRCIENTVQKTLNTLETDCQKISQLIQELIDEDIDNRSVNSRGCFWGFILFMLGLIIPTTATINFLTHWRYSRQFFEAFIAADHFNILLSTLDTVSNTYSAVIPEKYSLHAIAFLIALVTSLLLISRACCWSKPTLTRKERKEILRRRDLVENYVTNKKQELYSEYLNQSAIKQDF